ncbi:hypothetical protein [Streptomyces bobili]|uniref:hypothetical protein n=1 Tax=Streptomyces bobili TaxID=67280 RepID=UPI000A3AB7AE|nr:hypothetical protein [Streptomyces bobili]
MSADDIERALQKRRGAENAAQQAEERRRAELFAAGAEAARGFIDLMRRHGVQSETVYEYEQVKRRKNRFAKWETVDDYTPLAQGWVVDYYITEYGDPASIEFLQVDGSIRRCDRRSPYRIGLPVEGLLPHPPHTALGTAHTLCVKPGYEPGTPTVTVEKYAEAAQWYLG